MRTVTFQNGKKITFNSIYFPNEFFDRTYFSISISFSLSNKDWNLKKYVNPIFLKTKVTWLSLFEKNYIFTEFF